LKRLNLAILLAVSWMLIFFTEGFFVVARAGEIEEITVTIQGKGSLRVTPDLALIYMGVEVTAPTAQQATRENARIMQTVLDKLSSFNIPKEEIKTSWFSLWQETEYREGERIFKGFRVSHTLEVPVVDIPRLGEILDAAVGAGVNIVNNVTFSLQDTREAYEKVLLKAIENARHKAEKIAEVEGLHLKQIKRVVEKQSYAPQYGAEGEEGEFKITPFIPGQLKIEAVVEVTFSLSQIRAEVRDNAR